MKTKICCAIEISQYFFLFLDSDPWLGKSYIG